MVVSVATPRAAASLPRSWVPLRESPTAYEVSRAASRALVRRQLAYASSGDGAPSAVPTINSETLTAFLSDLRLDTFEPLLARLPAGTFAGASGPPIASTDLRRFVVAAARAAADNAQLVAMLRDCRSSLEVPSDEEVHRLVHYCLCLHLITKELAASPELAREVLEHQCNALRASKDWWKFLSAFEHAKLITLERALVFFSYHRAPAGSPAHRPIPANFGRIGLPFNVFEAVLQDAAVYRQTANAWSGVPLVLARPGRARVRVRVRVRVRAWVRVS